MFGNRRRRANGSLAPRKSTRETDARRTYLLAALKERARQRDRLIADLTATLDAGENVALWAPVSKASPDCVTHVVDKMVPCVICLTDRRLLWALPGQQAVLLLRFEEVKEVRESRGWLRLSYEPFDYPNALRPHNPAGQLDADFLFEHNTHQAVLAALQRRSASFIDWRSRAAEFRAHDGVAVASWLSCPCCGKELSERTVHTVHCEACGHYFADNGFEPLVSASGENYGELSGEGAWTPTTRADMLWQPHTLALVLAPPTDPAPNHLLYDNRLIEESGVAATRSAAVER